jgi:hypothetical protein
VNRGGRNFPRKIDQFHQIAWFEGGELGLFKQFLTNVLIPELITLFDFACVPVDRVWIGRQRIENGRSNKINSENKNKRF